MDEAEILAHLLSRDERGLQAAQERYGSRLKGLAQRIAGAETAEECINDALLAAWNAIPPLRPRSLYAYLCRLTRNAALNRFASQSAQKRGGTEAALSLDELAELLSKVFIKYARQLMIALRIRLRDLVRSQHCLKFRTVDPFRCAGLPRL